ncbi:hypothetical protein B5F77_05835 [Parabacteroides sp. An277]|nr:hypothetical protein B5F77_05835 [Parabacteroides sp. An277]
MIDPAGKVPEMPRKKPKDRDKFFWSSVPILRASSIFLYLQAKDIQISPILVQISSIFIEMIGKNGSFHRHVGKF